MSPVDPRSAMFSTLVRRRPRGRRRQPLGALPHTNPRLVASSVTAREPRSGKTNVGDFTS